MTTDLKDVPEHELLNELRRRNKCAILCIDYDDLQVAADDAGANLTDNALQDFGSIVGEIEDMMFEELCFRMRRLVLDIAIGNGLAELPEGDD